MINPQHQDSGGRIIANPALPKNVGFIDLGTNSARLLVVRLNPNCSYAVLTSQKEPVRLGEGEFVENLLTPEAIDRTVVVIARLGEIARSYSVDEIIAVATSATRDAMNRDDLIQRVRQEAGIGIKVISGPEEARLIWLGVSSGVEINAEKCLFIDIGGGSTEIVVGDQKETYLLRSLKLGAIRTTNKFITPDQNGPVPDAIAQAIRKEVRGKAFHTIRHLKRHEIRQAFGSSGTITTFEAIAAQMKGLSPPHQQGFLTLPELRKVVKHLCGLPLSERKNVPGINPDRADIIVAGGLILESLLTLSGIQTIQVSSRSLRDGMLVDYLARIPGFPHEARLPVRDTSIRQLGRYCQINEVHASHVAYLALSLFDSAKESGLHTLPDSAREILSSAAFLHDTGQFISFSGHHQHSFYLITHAQLLGFTEDEILKIALVSRYHRKKPPRKKDAGFSGLNPEEKEVVTLLSQFLRMAENLDRSHDSRIIAASLQPKDSHTVTLAIRCRSDCTLEQWAILGDQSSFEQTFRKRLSMEITGIKEENA
jgi:exopolyphosphatase/guanosine-5'-triphosphate,3'-diphosphate pyrophosphatase